MTTTLGVVDEAAVEASRTSLRGPLITPDDPVYDEARKVWNGMIDRRPALIARDAAAADVVTCVNFARETGIVLSVRGGAHNMKGSAVCDRGLVIDCFGMKAIRVDSANRRVRA